MITAALLETKSDLEVEHAAYQLADLVPWYWTPGQKHRWRRRVNPWLPSQPGEVTICSATGWETDFTRYEAAVYLCQILAITHELGLEYDTAMTELENIRTFAYAAAGADEGTD
jgi:hypothetical protein